MNTKHFDGLGHPILDYFGMLKYYANDNKSLSVLRQYAPMHYRVQPDVLIEIDPEAGPAITITVIYPAGKRRFELKPQNNVLCAMRRLYSSKTGQWRAQKANSKIILQKRGFLEVLHTSTLWDGQRARE